MTTEPFVAAPRAWPSASLARRFLALLVDAGVFGLAWLVGLEIAGSPAGSLPTSGAVGVLAFVVVEALLVHLAGWTPGHWLLRIRPSGRGAGGRPARGARPPAVVEPWVLSQERWWTLLFGLLAMGAGIWLIGAALVGPSLPGGVLDLVVALLAGAGGCALGVAVLRLQIYALPLGVAMYALLLTQVLDTPALLPPVYDWMGTRLTGPLGVLATSKLAGVELSDAAPAVSSAGITLVSAGWLLAVCARIVSVRSVAASGDRSAS